jgi:high-affinity iron transporter
VNVGAFSSGLLTGLREGVEAALIVSIVLAYLARTGNTRYFSRIWLGTAAAVAVSIAAGIAIYATTRTLPPRAEQLFEGTTLLFAAAVVTWMLFWMRRQSMAIKGELQAQVDRAVTGGSVGLVVLAFTAIIREGIETSLFLVGQATSAEAGAPSIVAGAITGLAIAALLGYGFYRGTRRINLGAFFRWTGAALVFIAAGLLAHAVHEFVEAGVVTVATQPAFDISAVLPHETDGGNLVGQFLAALFGYSSRPEVIALAVYLAYLVTVLALYLRPARPKAPAAPRPPQRTEATVS